MTEIARVFGSEGLANQVTLVIPSTTDVNHPLSHEAATEVANRALRFLSELYGGATAIPARGAWVAQNGQLIVEGSTLVYSFCGQLTTDDLIKIKAFCESLKWELKQEALAVQINGKLLFV